MSLETIAEHAAGQYLKLFGQPPQRVAAAPGRVNLIGEHTDYNDGFVLPMAIDYYTVMAGEPQSASEAKIHSVKAEETVVINLREPLAPGEPTWANYVRGVIAGFQQRGVTIPGFNAVIDSTVPLGSGLSSSAALEVATATFLEGLCRHPLDPVEKALLSQQAEHKFAGVPCGIMDQFASVLAQAGHLLLLDCQSKTTEQVPMNDPSVAVLIINTNVHHKLCDGEYAKRRAECETAARLLKVPSLRSADLAMLERSQNELGPVVFRRARHVITEIDRTIRAAKAFRASDWPAAGTLMYGSHASLRDDYEVSCKELDAVVEIARAIGPQGGVIGCRMTGGGFGGCAVSLVKQENADAITQKIGEEYKKAVGKNATIFRSRPAAGARLLK